MKWLGPSCRCGPPSSSASSSLTMATSSPTHGRLAVRRSSHRSSSPSIGPWFGKNGMKWNRRRSAASTRAIDRSAVFIVPMNQRSLGQLEGVVGPVQGAHGLVAVLEQEQQLAEHLGQVGPVDLVDDHDVALAGRVAARSAISASGPGVSR